MEKFGCVRLMVTNEKKITLITEAAKKKKLFLISEVCCCFCVELLPKKSRKSNRETSVFLAWKARSKITENECGLHTNFVIFEIESSFAGRFWEKGIF